MTARPRIVSTKARESLTAHAAYDGPRVTITTQIAPAAWRDVKAILEALDAVYVVGTSGFQFPADVDARETVAAALQAGQVMTSAQSAGFVATPVELAAELVADHADLTTDESDLRVLEPSAGTGRLVAAILGNRSYRIDVVAVEMDERRAAQIEPDDRVTVVRDTVENFAATTPAPFDRIVMNPPFAIPGKPTLWASHLLLAWQLLAPGGRLLAILPASVLRESPTGADAKKVAALVRENGGTVELEPDAFAESGIGIRTAAVWLDRPPAGGTAAPPAAAGYLAREYPAGAPAVRVPRPILTRAAAATVAVQVWADPWRGDRDRVLRYAGDCAGCGTPTWAFSDGENDPRGCLGLASAGWSLDAAGHDMVGPTICLCALCGDDGDAYRKAVTLAEPHWAAVEPEAVKPAALPAPRPVAVEQLVLL